jgi:hypothetical protein
MLVVVVMFMMVMFMVLLAMRLSCGSSNEK